MYFCTMKREVILTADGSKTIYIPEMDENYHSTNGALQEALHVFIQNGIRTINFNDEIKVFENFWIKTEIIDPLKEKKFHIANAKIDGISSISLNLAGQLLQHVEDCISVYHQKSERSADEILEIMIRVAINHVHNKLIECCDTDELLENNIFAYDHE